MVRGGLFAEFARLYVGLYELTGLIGIDTAKNEWCSSWTCNFNRRFGVAETHTARGAKLDIGKSLLLYLFFKGRIGVTSTSRDTTGGQ